MTISLSSLGKDTLIAGVSVATLSAMISSGFSKSGTSLPNVTTSAAIPKPTTSADAPVSGGPSNTPIYASGNAASADTALRKQNVAIKHICSIPQNVATALARAGAMGGQLIQAIRNGIKVLLAALGINPPTSGLVSQLKKLAQYIKDITKIIQDITNFVNGLIVYVNAVKQLIAYIVALPAVLLVYFKDCLQQAYRILAAGYLDVISTVADTPGGDSFSGIISAAGDVINSTGQLIKSATALAATPAALTAAVLQPGLTPVANSAAQAAATAAVFAAAGFSNTTSNFSKA